MQHFSVERGCILNDVMLCKTDAFVLPVTDAVFRAEM